MKTTIKKIIRHSDGSITTVDYNRHNKKLKPKHNERTNINSQIASRNYSSNNTRILRGNSTSNTFSHQLQFNWWNNPNFIHFK